MEKDRSARLIAIVALVLAVTGVSIGFAVLSTNLTIQPVEANVKADNKLFTVYFSSNPSSYEHSTVDASLSESVDGFTGKQLTVGKNSTTLSGIGGTFTKPGQTITYHLGVSNTSKLDGYLTAITFKNAASSESKVKCEAVATNSNAMEAGDLATACDDITVSVKVNGTEYKDSNATISKNEITAETTQTVDVVITYKESAKPATGDFKATFGDIELVYKTKDNAGAGA